MTDREWLNVLAILESIDDVPGFSAAQNAAFLENPVHFFRRAPDAARAMIWAVVEGRRVEPPHHKD